MLQRIDSHQHFWRPTRGDYGWLRADDPQVAPLHRDYLPHDLKNLLAAHHVVRTVLVQAAPSEAETDFMLQLASAHDFIGGVVGWVDISQASSIATLERFARHPKFKGVRPMLQELDDPAWIAHAPHPEVMRALQRLNLRFDALVKPWHLEPLLKFVRTWPDLPVVIDHAAKPQLAAGWRADWAAAWRRGMAELAALPRIVCKVSGLLTEAHVTQRPNAAAALATLRPVWDAVLTAFGPRRLMWGSDWPVLTLAADYGQWLALTDALVDGLAATDLADIWSGTARRFYALKG